MYDCRPYLRVTAIKADEGRSFRLGSGNSSCTIDSKLGEKLSLQNKPVKPSFRLCIFHATEFSNRPTKVGSRWCRTRLRWGNATSDANANADARSAYTCIAWGRQENQHRMQNIQNSRFVLINRSFGLKGGVLCWFCVPRSRLRCGEVGLGPSSISSAGYLPTVLRVLPELFSHQHRFVLSTCTLA